MSKSAKIGLAIAAVLALLLLAFALRQQDKHAPGKENSVETIGEIIGDKTHQTKLKAYDAYANEKEDFYNRPFGGKPQQVAQPAVVEEPAEEAARRPARHSGNDEQFDAAYQEVEQNVRSIYDNTGQGVADPGARASQPKAPEETAEERRRKAMLKDWGMGSKNNSPSEAPGELSSMFRAVIHGTQLVKSGQVALFRTKEQICFGSLVVPANTLLSGFASVSSNRLTIKISSVRINQQVFPLPLEVYGTDGIAGIPLNYNEAGQIADAQASSTAIQEATSAMSSYGGTVGRVAGALVGGIGNQVRNAKNVEIKLIDNQTIILKIAKQ